MRAQQIIARARKIRREFIEPMADTLDDATSLDMPELFPRWEIDTDYATGEKVRYADKLYKCVQSHQSLKEWAPSGTPALWVEVAKPGEIPEWRQPLNASDAYNTGDKVRHNESVWTSDVDTNVWEPGVYGWTQD